MSRARQRRRFLAWERYARYCLKIGGAPRSWPVMHMAVANYLLPEVSVRRGGIPFP